ncbi:uncharacterized protein LOC133908537 isoform X2 [Phragmites australis]|uniref:uncharacterized protein LOC133908537 isoform X2 n=1 Tax=Phragmites australis TaxID=29695 RepID=UPI002D790D8E|nr:uncharacterized protein LOC133908537 isoform X2 [Phragmites australis]
MPPPPHPPPPLPPHPPAPPPLNAHRFPLPPTHPPPASLLLAPPSSPTRALALLFPDSSSHLFPSLPAPTATAARSPAPTAIPAPLAAAACFALLLPSSHLLFLSAHPSPASPAVHLRAYSLASGRFAPSPLSFKRQVSGSGLPLQGLPFGLGVRLAGGVNAVALLSLAAGQIWVLAPRLAADGRTVELHKCAVVELESARPVYAMEVAMGRLLLGEAGGVRVFSLRGLLKGGKERQGKNEGAGAAGRKSLHKNGMLNGLIVPVRRGSCGGRDEGDAVSACKLTTLRVKQSSGSYCSFLLTFKNDDHNSQGGMELFKSVKVVSIHPLSKNKFLVLDSSGLLHVFSLSNEKMGSGASSKQYSENIHTYRLDYPMKVQLAAVFPSSSTNGGHTVHVMSAFDVESPNGDNGDGIGERELATIKLSAIEAIFTSEIVEDIVPISKDSVLILGQGNMFLYGTA